MLAATEVAGAHLSSVLARANAADDMAMRVVVKDNRLALVPDKRRPGDETFDHDGKTVLLAEEQVAALLGSKTFDVADEGDGPQLRLV